MSSDDDHKISDDKHDEVHEMRREVFNKNPNATSEEQRSHLLNYLWSQEPAALLEQTNEPSLQREASPQFEAYRFYYIAGQPFSLSPSRWIRMERDENGCRIVVKIRVDDPAIDDWKWESSLDCSLDEKNFEMIAQHLERANFWDTACTAEEVSYLGHGSSMVITGRKASRYHTVHRLMELPAGLAEAFRLVDRLAGLDESNS